MDKKKLLDIYNRISDSCHNLFENPSMDENILVRNLAELLTQVTDVEIYAAIRNEIENTTSMTKEQGDNLIERIKENLSIETIKAKALKLVQGANIKNAIASVPVTSVYIPLDSATQEDIQSIVCPNGRIDSKARSELLDYFSYQCSGRVLAKSTNGILSFYYSSTEPNSFGELYKNMGWSYVIDLRKIRELLKS